MKKLKKWIRKQKKWEDPFSLYAIEIEWNPSSRRFPTRDCTNLTNFRLFSICSDTLWKVDNFGGFDFSSFDMNMYRDRGGGGASKAGEMLDRKRINDALDKHLEKSSPSTSRNKGSAVSVPSTSAAAGKHVDLRDSRSSSALTASKNKLSEGALFLFLISSCLI